MRRFLPLSITLWGGVFGLMGTACSSPRGELISSGMPLGNFTFEPKRCRFARHMNFFGVVLLEDGPGDGSVLLVEDVVQGKIVKVEAPGSCLPPDYQMCTEVTIDPRSCTTYDVLVRETGGHLRLACSFPQGGTLRADLAFSSCN